MWEETDDPPGDRQKVALWLGRGYDMMRAEEEEPEGAAGDGGSSRGMEGGMRGMRGRLGSRGLPRGCAAIQAGASVGGGLGGGAVSQPGLGAPRLSNWSPTHLRAWLPG